MIPSLSEGDFNQTILMKIYNYGKYDVYNQKRVLWSIDRKPSWDDSNRQGFISFPTLAQISQTTMEEMTYSWLFIRLYDNSDTDVIDRMTSDLKEATGLDWIEAYKVAETTADIKKMIEYVFSIAIAIMMFLCFFSLSASMSANLYD